MRKNEYKKQMKPTQTNSIFPPNIYFEFMFDFNQIEPI